MLQAYKDGTLRFLSPLLHLQHETCIRMLGNNLHQTEMSVYELNEEGNEINKIKYDNTEMYIKLPIGLERFLIVASVLKSFAITEFEQTDMTRCEGKRHIISHV